MDRFMDSHPEIAEQLRRAPSLVNNKKFVNNHPDLQQFLAQHPGVREEYTENPNGFMRQEQRFDRREDHAREGDATMRQLSNMHRRINSHPHNAAQIQRDPTLLTNKQIVDKH